MQRKRAATTMQGSATTTQESRNYNATKPQLQRKHAAVTAAYGGHSPHTPYGAEQTELSKMNYLTSSLFPPLI